MPNKSDAIVVGQDSYYSDPGNYIQIGCDYFLKVQRPDNMGNVIQTLIPWKLSQIRKDFKSNPADKGLISRFYGMGAFPSHTDYKESVSGYYNTYSKLPWIPKAGGWSTIRRMLEHIFGEQIEYGLDYIQLLYTKPTLKLPILLLVSQMRNTGKTTFLRFLREMFCDNFVFASNESIRSHFNSDWASKLIVGIDETLLQKKEDSEKLKALSTANKSFIEYKGRDRYEVDNTIKFILCSNNVTEPVYIDAEETRYWVREIPTLTKDIPNITDELKVEIPAFIYFLLHRELYVSEPLSRMWFDTSALKTQALTRIIQSCRPTSELELAETILDQMDYYGVNELSYTSSDLNALLKHLGRDIRDAHRIICKQWVIPHASDNLTYNLYAPWFNGPKRYTGRFYTFTREYLQALVPNSNTTKK